MIHTNPITRLQEKSNLTPTEASDYWNVVFRLGSTSEWADRRGVSQRAVSSNVDSAIKKLENDLEPVAVVVEEVLSQFVDVRRAQCRPRGVEYRAINPGDVVDDGSLFREAANQRRPEEYVDEKSPTEKLKEQLQQTEAELGDWWKNTVGMGNAGLIGPMVDSGKYPEVTFVVADCIY